MTDGTDRSKRILVIDDDPETVDITKRLLGRHNYSVDEFTDPTPALDTNSGTQVILLAAYTSMGKVLDKVVEAVALGVHRYSRWQRVLQDTF
jgi:DNA-binding NtrC family response regulator